MLERALRAAVGLSVLCSAGALALGEPLVAVLYQHGAFSQADTLRVAALLAVFALAMPGWIAQQVAVRGFYARSDMWRPMLLGSAIAVVAIPLYQTLGARFGASGLAGAGAIAMSANAYATLVWLRLLHGGPKLGIGISALLRAVPPAALAAAAAAFASAQLRELGAPRSSRQGPPSSPGSRCRPCSSARAIHSCARRCCSCCAASRAVCGGLRRSGSGAPGGGISVGRSLASRATVGPGA